MFNLYIFCLITLVISYPQGVNLIAFLDSLNDQTSLKQRVEGSCVQINVQKSTQVLR